MLGRHKGRWLLAAMVILLEPALPLAAQECTFGATDWEYADQLQQLGRLRRCLHEHDGVWSDDRGTLWLRQAARHTDNSLIILTLLQGGADASTAGQDGRTALHIAAADNHGPAGPSINAELLQWTGDPNPAIPDSRWTPLHLAAGYNNNPGVVKVLLEGGADPLAADHYGWNPLHLAVYFDDLQSRDSTQSLLTRISQTHRKAPASGSC